MPLQNYIQNNFSHGELDPRLYAGTNLDYYYKSLKKCRNLYVRPQGGVKKRHGTIYEATLSALEGQYELGSFFYDSNTQFILIFQPLVILAYQVDVTNGSIIANFSVSTPYTSAQIPFIRFSQNGNLMIIVHPAYIPKTLIWDPITPAFTFSDLNIKNYPAYDFEKNYYTSTFTLSATTLGTGRVLTCSLPIFTNTNYEGGLFTSLGLSATGSDGVARLRTVTSTTTMDVDIIYAFDSSLTSPVPGSTCFLGEKAISDDRGWPKTLAFYEGRLAIGSTVSIPQTVFFSSVEAFNDFDEGNGSDDNGFPVTLSSSDAHEIKYMVSDKTLQIFCDTCIYSSMQYYSQPLSPSNSAFRKQVPYGVGRSIPLVLDNQTIFIQNGGKSLRSLMFDPNSATYTAPPISIFSSILVKDPIDGCVLLGDAYEDADYMFLVNTDGTLLVYQTVMDQNVSAFSLCVTGTDHVNLDIISPNHSKFKKIINIGNKIYAIIERVINGVTVQYLERFSFDYFTDSSALVVSTVPTKVLGGLSHLVGERVRVIGDGFLLRVDNSINHGLVTEDGTVTLLDEAVNFKVGLNFNVLMETIPANIVGSGRLYIPKKLVRLFIDYYESLGIKVNGTVIPDLRFGENVLDEPPILRTGVYTARGESWGDRVSLQITQDDPLPFLIIGLGMEVTE